MHINLAFIKNKLNALILNITNIKIDDIKFFHKLMFMHGAMITPNNLKNNTYGLLFKVN